MLLLIDLLRGDLNGLQPERISGAPVSDSDFEATLALAKEEHVLPWAASLLRARHPAPHATLSHLLSPIERDATVVAFCRNSELKSVLRSFHQSSLRVVLLKGPALAERLYGNTALRVSRDLDLLVSKSDLPHAESVLTATGFIPSTYQDDYHRRWYREATTIELHHDVENPLAFDFKVSAAIQQASLADFQGQSYWHLAPADELLYLCLHAARHRFERLSLIVDLQLAFGKMPRDVSSWGIRPEMKKLRSLLVLGAAMVARLHPNASNPLYLTDSAPHLQHLDPLADRLWHRLLTQPREPMDWRAAHSFFLDLESPGWPRLYRRYRHLQILLSRIIEPDYKYAARFGLNKNWQVHSLRPLRLLSKVIRRTSHASSTL